MEKIKTRLMSLKKYENLEVDTIVTAELAGLAVTSLALGVAGETNFTIFGAGMMFMTFAYLSAKMGKRTYEVYQNDIKALNTNKETHNTKEDLEK